METYQVIPTIEPVTLPAYRTPSFFGHALGCAFLVYFVVPFPYVFMTGESMSAAAPFGLKAGVLIGAPLGILICWIRLQIAQVTYPREHANTVALTTTREANEILELCDRELANLVNALREAETCVRQAEADYSDRAFSPFWGTVEQASGLLMRCAASAQRLKAESERYVSLLSAKRHNFPISSIRGHVPNPRATLASFKEIVRMGQTDWQFASMEPERRKIDKYAFLATLEITIQELPPAE